MQAGKVAPGAKDHFAVMAQNNFDATKAAIDAMPVILKAGDQPEVKTDPAAPAGALTADEINKEKRLILADLQSQQIFS